MRTFESRTAFNKRNSAQHIVLKIFSGIDHRFAHVGVGSKVHDRINPAQDRCKLAGVRNISHNQLKALGQRRMAGDQIVVNDGFVAAAFERQARRGSRCILLLPLLKRPIAPSS